MSGYVYLLIAISAEVFATSALKRSESFTRLWPSVAVAVGYGVAFYCLSVTLKTVPVGIAYAIWSGMGIVLVSVIAWLVYDQSLDLAAIAGMALILIGVVVMQAFSKSIHLPS
jgi:small multidrug resistance pump